MYFNRHLEFASREEDVYRSVLYDWFGGRYRRRLVSKGSAVWFVKCKSGEERRRDKLAALLGQGWLNIADVECLAPDRFLDLLPAGIKLPNNATHENTYLVRFGPDYGPEELPLEDPDLALASELVFSLWIRRRDAHSFNRVYRAGVPIFFDCGVAFLGEPRLADLDCFFQIGPDPGYAGLWRIRTASPADLDTLTQRQREIDCFRSDVGNPKVFLPVIDRDRFLDALSIYADRIAEFKADQIRHAIHLAGYRGDQEETVFAFLERSRSQLQTGTERLYSTLVEPE